MLSGVRVLELAGVLAGPSVGMFLAEAGASVIKVENPATGGDVTRSWKLPSEDDADTRSSYFNSVNWGKESVLIDLKSPEGKQQVEGLIAKSDIVLTSFKPGDAEKLGLAHEDFLRLKPDIITGTITGFGPDDTRTAYDALLQAEAGFMYLNREPGGLPMKMPVALMDILAAHHLRELLLMAWIHKLKTGEGSRVETSLYEAAVCSLANQAGAWLYAHREPEPMGSEHPHIYPYGCSFKAGDGREIVLAVGNDRQFSRLCFLLNIEGAASDSRFSTNPERSRNRDALRETLKAAFDQFPDSETLLASMHKLGIPAGMVRRVSEAVEAYGKNFHMHVDGGMKGIPVISGTINGKRASMNLKEPPGVQNH